MNEHTAPASTQKKAGYFIATFIISLLTPVLALLCAYLVEFVVRRVLHTWGYGYTYPTFIGAVLLVAGYFYGRRMPSPKGFFARNLPYFMPVYIGILAFAAYSWESGEALGGEFLEVLLGIALGLCFLAFWAGFTVGQVRRERPERVMAGIARLALIFVIVCIPLGLVLYDNEQYVIRDGGYDDDDYGPYADGSAGHDVPTYRYMPFRDAEWSRLYKADFPVSLSIDKNWPRLDGAIAVLPVYAAFAEATYKGLTRDTVDSYVDCNNTPIAFQKLLDGEVDLFFGVPPSEKQLEAATKKGVKLTVTPLAKEAFVFFVNKDNPVGSLTIDQIQDIYSKKITDWKDVGGNPGPISPFQRPEGSGSQSAMQNMVMKDRKLARPLKEEYYQGMGGIVRGVAQYRNGVHAVGYSFRWYATELIKNPDIKLLSVNGVAPTPENIAKGAYPLSTNLVVISARELSPESQALMDWMLGPEGQRIIKAVGYVSMDGEN